ncbi:hypothetical protein [Inediibacterium massiliense]|uniref:hypothetical protein n=1 Tax=Inediibacterium massiliense TaxID=1658111 RepID=UPI0006B42BD2|nr:hypothetical protein [Inediibacterium massiliense]
MEEIHDSEFDRSELIEYIRTLRVEEFRKMNLSSFKIAALIIFIITVGNKLLTILSDAKVKNDSVQIYILVFLLISINNVYRIGWFSINSLFRKSTTRGISIKKYSKLDKQVLLLGFVNEFIHDIGVLGGNIYLYKNISIAKEIIVPLVNSSKIISSSSILLKIAFISYFCFFTDSTILFLSKIQVLCSNYLRKHDENERDSIDIFKERSNALIEQIESQGENAEKYRRCFNYMESKIPIIQKGYCTVGRILFICSAILFLSMMYIGQEFVFQYVDMFKNCVYIFGIVPALELIALYISSKIIYSWLECFERKIFRENLRTDQIMNILNSEFINKVNTELFYYSDKQQA